MFVVSYELRKLQLLQLLPLLEIRRICDKYNIQYSLAYGTLLGAVRHKGFIPWDDDVDVIMTRDNYNKFHYACQFDLDPHFYLESMDNNTKYSLLFPKLCLRGTKMTDYFSDGGGVHYGIWVDIFICDNAPEKKIIQLGHKFVIKLLKATCNAKLNVGLVNSPLKRFLRLILTSPLQLLDINQIKILMKHVVEKYNSRESTYVLDAGSPDYWRNLFPRYIFDDYCLIEFENISFSISKYYHELLQITYGDYMIIPPDSERERHVLTEFSFGDYQHVILDNSTVEEFYLSLIVSKQVV